MSKGNTFENDLLKLIFWGDPIAGLAENDTSSPVTEFEIALHTADPGEAGTQTTNETAYTGYARKTVDRTNPGFEISGNVVTLSADLDFDECTASPGGDLTHFSIGDGTGKILYKGTITPNIVMQVGTIPRLKAATSVTED